MIQDVMKSAAGLVVCGLAMFLVVEKRDVIYSAVGLTPQETPKAEVVHVVKPAPKAQSSSGGRVTLEKNPRDGQFWAEAKINNRKVTLLVDTGASSVALTPEDAKRAGIRLKSLNYNVPVSTAGGQVMAARTTIKSLKVGSIRVRDVRAVVIPDGLHVSLLGMTYLGQVRKIEVSSDKMVLRN